MGFLDGLLSSKEARSPAVKDAATGRATATQRLFSYGFPYRSNWDVARAVTDGWERVIWVYRAIDAIARNARRLPMHVMKDGEREGTPVTDFSKEPILRLLNKRANPYETAAMFRYRLSAQLLLSKKGVFVEIVYSAAGLPVAMHLLPPQYMSPVPHPTEFVKEFELAAPTGPPERIPAFNPDGTVRVLWLRAPHPTDPLMGSTPLEAAGISVDMDFWARLYNRTFLQNDGRPGGILGVKGDPDEDDAEELRNRFTGGGAGPMNAGRVSVINADALSWIDTAVSPRDAQYVQSLKATKEDILMSFGVPESIIGNAAGRTYDNADAEREIFWMETMVPHLDLLAGFFDYLTTGGIDDDQFVAYNLSDVESLQRSTRRLEESDAARVKDGLLTRDEWRERRGLAPFDRPASRALWIPNSVVPIARDDADEEALAPPPPPTPIMVHQVPPALPPGDPLGLPAATDTTPVADTTPATDTTVTAALAQALLEAATKAIGGGGSTAPFVGADLETKAKVTALQKKHARWERQIKSMLHRYFTRQRKVVLEKLKGTKARKGTRYWAYPAGQEPAEFKELDPDLLFDGVRWDSELADDYAPIVLGINEETAADAGVSLGDPATVGGALAAAALTRRVENVQRVNDTTRDAIAEAVYKGAEAGDSIDEIGDRLNGVFDDAEGYRSDTIAASEAVSANNEAGLLAATELGDLVTGKTWYSAQDDQVRPTHQDVDGTTIPLDEAFYVGGSQLMFPGDPEGDASEVVNCRCTLLFESVPFDEATPEEQATADAAAAFIDESASAASEGG